MASPRVVSLLPSATELLCAAGGEDLLVGRSHECDWPSSILDRPVLTGQRTRGIREGHDSRSIDEQVRAALAAGSSLYTLDEDLLRRLRPDLILTQDLCEVCSIDLRTVERLAEGMSPRPTIVNLNPSSLEQVLDDLLRIGRAVDRERPAEEALVALRERFWSAVDYVTPYVDGPGVAFLEWLEPIFVGGHWTPQLVEAAGGRHPLNPAGAKSRQVSPEDLVQSQPDALVVCPCGMGLADIRREVERIAEARWWKALPAVADGRVALVDGSQMFNRPGPRLVEAFRWLVGWLHARPEVIPPDVPWEPLDRR